MIVLSTLWFDIGQIRNKKACAHVKTRAMVAIKKALDDAQVNIPYLIRTIFITTNDQEKYSNNLPHQKLEARN